MNICESLTSTAKLLPDKTAIWFEGQSITYSQLNHGSAAAAEVLCDMGVGRGDRVAIKLPNVPAFAIWYYAALRVGAIAVSVSSRLADSEVQFVIEDCQPKAFVENGQATREGTATIVTSDDGLLCNGKALQSASDAQAGFWHRADPNDAALILYTSGTTGFPKGATLSHANVRSNVAAFNHLCNQQSKDVVLLAVPLFHCFGQNALLNSVLNVGATLVMQRQFDLTEAVNLIQEQGVTQLYGVPMMFGLLHDRCDASDLSSVNYCFSAATTLPIQTAQRWREKFNMPIHEGYGLTETSPFASYNHKVRFTPGSIGTPIDAVEMKVVDPETGQECQPGEPGEIIIRGPNVMLGYWNRDEETAESIRAGWFHSGDIGQVDQDGFFYIVDRVKDMISVGGLKVYPAEVERVLLDHASVEEAAVVGFPDEVFGEQVVAFLVSHEVPADAVHGDGVGSGSSHPVADDVRAFAQSRLANYKSPRQIIFLKELPRNPSGKILKKELRERNIPSPASADSAAQLQLRRPTLKNTLARTHANNRIAATNEFLQGLVQTIGRQDEAVLPETRLLDAGLDSLMIVEMSAQLQAELGPGHEFAATTIFDHPRVCDLAGFLVEQLYTKESAAIADHKPAAETVSDSIREEVESLSEQEAIEALLKELQ